MDKTKKKKESEITWFSLKRGGYSNTFLSENIKIENKSNYFYRDPIDFMYKLAEVYPLITGLLVYLKYIGVTGRRARDFSEKSNHHATFSITAVYLSKYLDDHKRFKTRHL